eukprot:COSAG03_NODE_1636_length_3735_cov_51.499725_3_plen_76_part_00
MASALTRGEAVLRVASAEVMDQWVLDGEVQKALERLQEQTVTQQLRALPTVVTRHVREGLSAPHSVSAALQLWQD